MKIKAKQQFDCYPDDINMRTFREGEEADDLADDYCAILIGKGLVERIDAPAVASVSPSTEVATETTTEAAPTSGRSKKGASA